MEDNFNMDQQIRKSLQKFEVMPDGQSFDMILQKMDQKRKRRGFMILFSLGCAMALTGVMVSLFLSGKFRSNALLASHSEQLSANIKHSWKEKERHHPSLTLIDHHKNVLNTTDNAIPSNVIRNRSVRFKVSSAEHNRLAQVNSSSASLPKFINTESKPNETFHRVNDSICHHVIDTVLVRNAIQKALYEMSFITPLILKDTIEPHIIERVIKMIEPDSLMKRKEKNDLAFYLGIQGNPQINHFAFSKNPNRDRFYNTPNNFPSQYLHAKKDNANVQYSTSFGIKTGITINHTYEIFVSFGYQKFTEKESLNVRKIDTLQTNYYPNIASSEHNPPAQNVFKSYYYSLEANRIFTSGKSLKFKTGVALSVNQLIASDYFLETPPNTYSYEVLSHTKLSSSIMIAKLKAGMIFNGNKRLQLHISPGVFYSITSIFQNDYVIRQRPYGVDVECLLLFRLYRMSGR